MTGTSWGGAAYLDNFGFVGMKSYDNCIPTSINETSNEEIQTSTNGNELVVTTGSIRQGTIEVYNIQGQKLAERKIDGGETIFNTTEFLPGIYFISLRNEKINLTRKFFVN